MKALLQFWEESERNHGTKPGGASLHIDSTSYNNYVDQVYSIRNEKLVPNEYDRIIGTNIEVDVSNDIYNILCADKNLRLLQFQLNNLIKLKDIII